MTATSPARDPKPVEAQFLELTPLEKRILRKLAAGLSAQEIADELELTKGNVHKRVERCSKRHNIKDRLRLVVRYLEEYCGVLDPVEELPDTDPTRRGSDGTR